jgi:hypothetical protein
VEDTMIAWKLLQATIGFVVLMLIPVLLFAFAAVWLVAFLAVLAVETLTGHHARGRR